MFVDSKFTGDITDPLILFDDLVEKSVVVGSGFSGEDYPQNVSGDATVDFWTPNALPAQVSFTLPSPSPASVFGVAGHNLYEKSCAVRLLSAAASSRMNKHLNSEDFTTGWSLSNPTRSSLTPSVSRDPSGTNNAASFLCTTTDLALRRLYATVNITVTPGQVHQGSLYVKSSGWDHLNLFMSASGSLSEVPVLGGFNLATGQCVAHSGSCSMASVGNGWWRIRVWGSLGPSTGYKLVLSLVNNYAVVTNNGTGIVGAGVFVWGGMVEQATTDGGYIKSSATPGISGYNSITEFLTPDRTGTLMGMFGEVTSSVFALEVTGPSIPALSVVKVGKALRVPAGISPSYTPLHLSREIDTEVNRSRSGSFFGSRIRRRGLRSQVSFSPMHRSVIEQTLRQFITHYDDGRAFFFCPSPGMFPLDTTYGWRRDGGDSMRPTFREAGEFMDVNLDLEAVA